MSKENVMSSESRASTPAIELSRQKTIAELAKEQGIDLKRNWDELVGRGADLWDSDEDFEAFLTELKAAKESNRKHG